MRCLVTGATGFVGSNLVRSLLAAGHEVLATGAPGSTTRYLDNLPVRVQLASLLDVKQVSLLVADTDWVFHLAGDTSTWSKLASRRRQVNVDATGLLADAAVRAGVRRFIHASTLDVHGYNSDGSALTETAGEHPLQGIGYDYADTKAEGEAEILKRMSDGLEVVVVYPGFMIGPYDHTLQLGRIVRDLQAGKNTLAPPGTGSFCDVRAVANAMLVAAERGRSGEGYNLTGYNYPYIDVFTRIGELVGAKRRPVRIPAPILKAYGVASELISMFTGRLPAMDSGMAKYLCAPQASDWSKAARELDYHPGDLDRAILDAAAWYDEHLPASHPCQ